MGSPHFSVVAHRLEIPAVDPNVVLALRYPHSPDLPFSLCAMRAIPVSVRAYRASPFAFRMQRTLIPQIGFNLVAMSSPRIGANCILRSFSYLWRAIEISTTALP